MSFLRNKGLLMVIYLEDLICIGNTYDDCSNCVTKAIQLLEHLGFVIHYSKSNLIPNQVKTFLGLELHSREMCVHLPNSKRGKNSRAN